MQSTTNRHTKLTGAVAGVLVTMLLVACSGGSGATNRPATPAPASSGASTPAASTPGASTPASAPAASAAPTPTFNAQPGAVTLVAYSTPREAYEERGKRIPTSELNRFFEKNLEQPRATTTARHPVRVLYLTQAAVNPPTFVLFTSSRSPRARLHFSYERYVENRLREEFSFFATPIRIKQRRKKGERKDD